MDLYYCIKNCPCHYFDNTIRLDDFHTDNILIDKKSQKQYIDL